MGGVGEERVNYDSGHHDIEMIKGEGEAPGEIQRKVLDEIFGRPRARVFLAILVIELGVFFAGMLSPLDTASQQQLLNEGKSIVQSATSGTPVQTFFAIFLNNFRVALLEMVPVLGYFLAGISLFTTGEVLQVFSLADNIPPIASGIATFVFPHALVEFAGYAFALTEGTMVIRAAVGRKLKAEIKLAGYEVIVVAATLALAALIETVEIVSPIVGLVMWLPVILIMMALFLKVRGGPAQRVDTPI